MGWQHDSQIVMVRSSRDGTKVAYGCHSTTLLLRMRKLEWERRVKEERLLLVQDQAPLRRSLENFFRRGGYAFDSCSTSREALVRAGLHPYRVAIVDYHLCDGDGAALIERLRAVQPYLQAIVISSYDFQAVADELRNVDVHAFLKKPFDPIDLETVLRSACARNRSLLAADSVCELAAIH
jgi:DNA-binding NtrC family response regulator